MRINIEAASLSGVGCIGSLGPRVEDLLWEVIHTFEAKSKNDEETIGRELRWAMGKETIFVGDMFRVAEEI